MPQYRQETTNVLPSFARTNFTVWICFMLRVWLVAALMRISSASDVTVSVACDPGRQRVCSSLIVAEVARKPHPLFSNCRLRELCTGYIQLADGAEQA